MQIYILANTLNKNSIDRTNKRCHRSTIREERAYRARKAEKWPHRRQRSPSQTRSWGHPIRAVGYQWEQRGKRSGEAPVRVLRSHGANASMEKLGVGKQTEMTYLSTFIFSPFVLGIFSNNSNKKKKKWGGQREQTKLNSSQLGHHLPQFTLSLVTTSLCPLLSRYGRRPSSFSTQPNMFLFVLPCWPPSYRATRTYGERICM